MRLDDASRPIVLAHSLEFGLDVGKIIISVCCGFVFDMMSTLQVVFSAVVLLRAHVRGKPDMRGPLIEVDGLDLVAVVGHVILEVVTALVVPIVDYLILLALPHESSLPLIVEGRGSLCQNDVTALATAGIVVRI